VAELSQIRNFAIIAHIDHGKSTLADRFLEVTGTVDKLKMREQLLDRLDLERERGITIKAQAVQINFHSKVDGKQYIFDLIDTPGHVDFTYEVSRSLAACEGAILLVDASQGIQAQTLANLYLAMEQDLTIIPVLNKIDLPAARPEELKQEIGHLIGTPPEEIRAVSAKTGDGVWEVLEQVAALIPPPVGDPAAPLRALIFDSHYDTFRGVIIYVRIVDGRVKKGDQILMVATNRTYEVIELGVFKPDMSPRTELATGEAGYLICTIRDIRTVKIGDTVTLKGNTGVVPLPGFVQPKQMVFCGLYPVEADDYERLTIALEKLSLNDASFTYEAETSQALGFGYRCGFLGLLHMEVIRERLEREYNLELVITVPNVIYQLEHDNGTVEEINNPADFPEGKKINEVREPYVKVTLISPTEYIGALMDLNHKKRGIHKKLEYLSESRVTMEYDLPLAELIVDYYDRLKAATKGYATLDYELIGFRASDLVRVNIMVNEEPLDALSFLCAKDHAYNRGREMVQRLRKVIPRHMFDVPIQAAIGGRIIARETIKAMRKDVLSKCYGGDITRKRKLLEKQKEGKRRMKMVGNVTIPQEAFLSVLDISDDAGD